MPLGPHCPGPSWPGALLSRGSAFLASTWTKDKGETFCKALYATPQRRPRLTHNSILANDNVLSLGQLEKTLNLKYYGINVGQLCKSKTSSSTTGYVETAVELCVSGTPQTNWENNALYSNAKMMQRVLKNGNRIRETAQQNWWYEYVPEKHRNVTFLWIIAVYLIIYI